MTRPENTSQQSGRAEVADLRDYLRAVFGDTEGHAHVVGASGYFDGVGTYSFKRAEGHRDAGWTQRVYAWPGDADQLADDLHRVRDTYDIFVCPYLMSGTKRTPGDAVELTKIHADIDGNCPLDKVAEVDGWAVSTGSPGHAHVYVDLAEPAPAHWHTALCRGLGAYLGDADAKIRANDVLRPPGTLNHKNRARGGESTPVEWLVRPTGVRWNPALLAAKLRVELPSPAAAEETPAATGTAKGRNKTKRTAGTDTEADTGSTAEDSEGEPFDLSAYPAVRRALAKVTDPADRSKDTARIVGAVYDAGLTVENARWAVEQRADLANRLDERADDDVERMWLKIDADRRAKAASAGGGLQEYHLTDAYIAERVAREAMGDFTHNAALGWRCWDSKRYAQVDPGAVLETVRSAIVDLHADLARNGARVAFLQEVDAILGGTRINHVVKLVGGIVTVPADRFDQHPDMLNVGNGVIDLRTGELGPHDRELMLTTLTPTDYVPGATHPDWTTALGAVSAEEADCLQVRLGQGITGHQPDDDKVVLLQGTGSNGKTVIVDGITHGIGEDHAVVVPEKVLVARPGDHPTELMTLRGARLALIEELPGGATLDVKRLKTIAGTGTITARAICKDNVSWHPTHSLFLTTNYLPHVSESDHGTWRRLLRVLFRLTFRMPGEALRGPDDRCGDPNLRDRVRRGGDGQHEAVLAWLVAGARRWYEAGRVMPAAPEAVIEATREWRAHADLLLRYADEHLVFDGIWHVMSDELFRAFAEWLSANGHQPWSDQRFTERLRDHSAFVEHRLERRRLRANKTNQQTLSRRRDIDAMVAPPAQYQSWIGLRFRTDADDADIAESTGNGDELA